jgi:phytoene synthase
VDKLMAPDQEDADLPIIESRAVIARHARSFRLASRFLPATVADEAAVLYAFCRLVDDTADEAPDIQTATHDLAELDDELEGERPARPAVGAFHTLTRTRDVPLQTGRDLIAGVGSDLSTVRIPDDAAFILYCYQVAGAVGLMMCGVLGVQAREAWPHAVSLGIGMQITNICRDVLEDAGRDRVYLPATRLEAAGLSQDQILDGSVDRNKLSGVVSGLLDLADEHYRYAGEGIHHIPWRARLGILVASRVYRAIGVRLRRVHGSDPMHGRTMTTAAEKLWWVLSGIFAALHPVVLGLIPGRRPRPETLRYVPILQVSRDAG